MSKRSTENQHKNNDGINWARKRPTNNVYLSKNSQLDQRWRLSDKRAKAVLFVLQMTMTPTSSSRLSAIKTTKRLPYKHISILPTAYQCTSSLIEILNRYGDSNASSSWPTRRQQTAKNALSLVLHTPSISLKRDGMKQLDIQEICKEMDDNTRRKRREWWILG